ncbi:MAG: GPO family capsid scaffolding protein [Phenylobacterium sp.]|nr:GPO family capsid scaffolding protein [Phenylobacterium sp.]
MSKSKFFRVAVEGATTDGRVIERVWIDEMAATYNPQTFGARINMEHIHGYSDQPPFCAYGDILALKAEDFDLEVGGKTEKRRALYAQIAPNELLLKANRAGQKVFTSVEVNPNFAGTGKAYLTGMAITDNPASLGVEMLEFAAKTPAVKALFDSRKQHKDNLFTAALETMFELEAEGGAEPPSEGGFMAAFTAFLNQLRATPAAPAGEASPPAAPAAAPGAAPAGGGDNFNQAAFLGLAQTLEASLKAQGEAFKAELQVLRQDMSGLTAKLSSTPDNSAARPESIGGAGQILADC